MVAKEVWGKSQGSTYTREGRLRGAGPWLPNSLRRWSCQPGGTRRAQAEGRNEPWASWRTFPLQECCQETVSDRGSGAQPPPLGDKAVGQWVVVRHRGTLGAAREGRRTGCQLWSSEQGAKNSPPGGFMPTPGVLGRDLANQALTQRQHTRPARRLLRRERSAPSAFSRRPLWRWG